MVGAPARTRALLLIVAGIAVLVAVEVVVHVGGAGSPPAPAGPAPRGLAARVDDETSPAAGGLVSWRSTWALCWDAYAGAQRYELRMLTGEGASPRLTSERGTCFRVEAAAGTSEPASMAGERDAQLASQRGQLAVQVRAVVRGGGRSDWSQAVAVGSP